MPGFRGRACRRPRDTGPHPPAMMPEEEREDGDGCLSMPALPQFGAQPPDDSRASSRSTARSWSKRS